MPLSDSRPPLVTLTRVSAPAACPLCRLPAPALNSADPTPCAHRQPATYAHSFDVPRTCAPGLQIVAQAQRFTQNRDGSFIWGRDGGRMRWHVYHIPTTVRADVSA